VILQAELALVLVAAGLYLYDSAMLLHGDEGVVIGERKRWAVKFGSGILIRGRNLFLPSPLLPHQPIFRLVWRAERPAEPSSGQAWGERRRLFAPFAPLVWGMFVSIFVLLPIGLFTRLGEAMVLAAIALLYLNIVALLCWLALRRGALGLSRARLAMLSFESLVCSPFALNLVRKISAAMPVEDDLIRVARRLQSVDDWALSRAQVIARIDEELDFEALESKRAGALKALKAELGKG
jgi:hypothetical protein